MPKQVIFLTGATGYIGGTVLWRLLHHKEAENFTLKTIVRNAEKARIIKEKFGIDAIVGSHGDEVKLESLASEADFVFAVADSDDLTGIKAILKGTKKLKERSGKTPVIINTSGTLVIADNAKGMYEAENVYDDLNVADIESLSLTQPHRSVDATIVAADAEGYVKSYIIMPATVFGLPKNGFIEAGLQNSHSIQVPALVRAGLDRGQGGTVGLGKNKWGSVHVDELSDLFMIVFDKVRNDSEETPHGREGYFFASCEEYALYDLYKVIAEALFEEGKGKVPEPTTFTEEELVKYFGGPPIEDATYMGTNARCIANRSFSMGWKPNKGTTELMFSVRAELESLSR